MIINVRLNNQGYFLCSFWNYILMDSVFLFLSSFFFLVFKLLLSQTLVVLVIIMTSFTFSILHFSLLIQEINLGYWVFSHTCSFSQVPTNCVQRIKENTVLFWHWCELFPMSLVRSTLMFYKTVYLCKQGESWGFYISSAFPPWSLFYTTTTTTKCYWQTLNEYVCRIEIQNIIVW